MVLVATVLRPKAQAYSTNIRMLGVISEKPRESFMQVVPATSKRIAPPRKYQAGCIGYFAGAVVAVVAGTGR